MIAPLLSLEKISFKVPLKSSPILDELSLDIYPGDFIIVLGSNGSGKSSLIKMINGLSSPTSGTLYFQGKNLFSRSISARARSIVTLTQDLNLSTFSQLTILENCLIASQRCKRISLSLSTKKERERIAALTLYNPQLGDKLDEPISSLSGGERQTLGLAMSLWNAPSLLLLDEHTSALDPLMAKKLMQLTHQNARANKITTVMTTHNLHDALSYGNRLIVMCKGKIVKDIAEPTKKYLTRAELLDFYA